MKQVPPRKPNARSRKDEGFTFGPGSTYADNAEYAEKKFLFTIIAIALEPGRGYDPGSDRWAITVQVDGREPEILTLGANPKRDEELRAAQAHLKRKGAIKNVRLVRSGSAYYFRSGSA